MKTTADISDFIEGVHLGEDLEYSWNGKHYFCEGWYSNGNFTLCMFEVGTSPVKYLWYKEGPDRYALGDEFLLAPVYDGKSFWDVKDQLEWVE